MKKGLFITLYGINNIGKSTHAKLLCKKLKEEGHKVFYIKYPNYTVKPSGPFLYKTLRNKNGQHISEDELQIWFILNRYQTEPKIKKLLEKGYIVVAEDYTGTGIAWGIAKGLDKNWLTYGNKNLLKEDFSILLTGQRSVSAKEKVHVHEQNDALVEECKKVHLELAEEYGWSIVELCKKVPDTAAKIWKLVDEFIATRYY